MGISMERAAMRGKLAEAENNLAVLRLQILGLCQSIRQSLNTALTYVEDLEIPQVAGQMAFLEDTWAHYQTTRIAIERLKKELA